MNCPKCDRPLEYPEVYNTENLGDVYIDYVECHCPHCNKYYVWEEVYHFSGTENFHELKEGDR